MRVGPVGWVPQRHDQLRAGKPPPDTLRGVFVVQILRARLADRLLAVHRLEQALVFASRLRAEPIFCLPLPPEVVRLLHGTDKYLRVLPQILVERGRAALVRADDEEVRQCHEPILLLSIAALQAADARMTDASGECNCAYQFQCRRLKATGAGDALRS